MKNFHLIKRNLEYELFSICPCFPKWKIVYWGNRWRGGGGYRNQKAMYEAILKYGWDNIKHIVLISNLKEDMAMEVEKALIEKYSTQDTLYGYNTKNGGQHFGEHSEQFLSNLKERMSGNAYCAGRKANSAVWENTHEAFDLTVGRVCQAVSCV